MQELFGIPMGPLEHGRRARAQQSSSPLVAALAFRNRVFFKLGVRNVTAPGRAPRSSSPG